MDMSLIKLVTLYFLQKAFNINIKPSCTQL